MEDPTFGQLLDELLRKYGYSYLQLAERLGIGRSAVTKWINDYHPPKYENVIRISVLLNLEESETKALLKSAGYLSRLPLPLDEIMNTVEISPSSVPAPAIATTESLPLIIKPPLEQSIAESFVAKVEELVEGEKGEPIADAPLLAFAPEAEGETLVIIASFFVTEGNRNILLHREIRDRLREELKNIEESGIRIETEATILNADQQSAAIALGEKYHASVIVWGDDTGYRIIVNILYVRKPSLAVLPIQIDELKRTQLIDEKKYQSFISNDLLPTVAYITLTFIVFGYLQDHNYTRYASIYYNAIEPALCRKKSVYRLFKQSIRYGWLNLSPAEISTKRGAEFDQAFTLFDAGERYLSRRKYEEAIREFDKAIALINCFSAAYLGRGKAYERLGMIEEALINFGDALSYGAVNPGVYVAFGDLYRSQGNYEAALVYLNEAVSLGLRSMGLFSTRALVYLAQLRVREGVIDMERASMCPSLLPYPLHRLFCFILHYLARSLTRKLNTAYEDDHGYFIEQTESNPELADALAKCEAKDDFTETMLLFPNDADVYFYRGNAYAGQLMFQEALDDYNMVISLNPDFAPAYIQRASILFAFDRESEALDDLKQALALRPEDWRWYLILYYLRIMIYLSILLGQFSNFITLKWQQVIKLLRHLLEFSLHIRY